jgi:hypothetical protein
MNAEFEDSLERLRLEDGVEGVQKLKPQRRLLELFQYAPEDQHLHIVVERPSTGKFQRIVAVTALLIDCCASFLVIPRVWFDFTSYNPPFPCHSL